MKTEHRCSACGHRSPRWFGRCPECDSWSSAQDVTRERGATQAEVSFLATASSVSPPRLATGISELDRVLDGGLVPGSVVLLAGEPGIGKSTLVLQMIDGILSGGHRCLLATGEESLDQVALRGRRLNVAIDALRATSESTLTSILDASSTERTEVLVVDSIQTVEDPSIDHGAGSVSQVRDCAAGFVRYAKQTGTVVIMVGHVTKEGSVAGPKTLEHMVDVVMNLEGERTGTLRLLRAAKNRFGSCDETGVFTMDSHGLEVVADPSAMLLADRHEGIAGSVVFPGLEGTRPVLVEIQALVTKSELNQPRRVAIGLDPRRMALILGVLSKDEDLSIGLRDAFVAAAGGLAVREPASDLAVCLALISAAQNAAVHPSTVAIGEVGLGGEVRRVPAIDRRLAEAARLGFTRAIVPRGVERAPAGIELCVATDVRSAITSTRNVRVA